MTIDEIDNSMNCLSNHIDPLIGADGFAITTLLVIALGIYVGIPKPKITLATSGRSNCIEDYGFVLCH